MVDFGVVAVHLDEADGVVALGDLTHALFDIEVDVRLYELVDAVCLSFISTYLGVIDENDNGSTRRGLVDSIEIPLTIHQRHAAVYPPARAVGPRPYPLTNILQFLQPGLTPLAHEALVDLVITARCLLVVIGIDVVLCGCGVLLPCESACLLLGLLKRLGVSNDTLGPRVGL